MLYQYITVLIEPFIHLFLRCCNIDGYHFFYSDGYRLSLPVLTVNYLPKKRNTKSKELKINLGEKEKKQLKILQYTCILTVMYLSKENKKQESTKLI